MLRYTGNCLLISLLFHKNVNLLIHCTSLQHVRSWYVGITYRLPSLYLMMQYGSYNAVLLHIALDLVVHAEKVRQQSSGFTGYVDIISGLL